MDLLIYHSELQTQSFPDCCIRCGAGNTELADTTLTSSINPFGGVFDFVNPVLPFCRSHIKPPLVSFSYLGIRRSTPEGIVIKNVSGKFVDALEEYREIHPPQRTAPAPPPAVSAEAERAHRRFAIGALIAAILAGVVIAVLVVTLSSPKDEPPEKPAPRRPSIHDLNDSDDFGPPGLPRRTRWKPPG